MKYSLQLALLIVLAGHPVKAQIWLSDKDIYDEAEEYRNANEFVEALPLYLLLEKKDLLTANVSYKIGECYLNIRGKKNKAIPYLEKAAQYISSNYIEGFYEERAPLRTLLLLGVAYRIDNRPKLAIQLFNQLKDSIKETDPEFLSVINMHIERCENAILLNAFPAEPRSEKLPPRINDEYSNYNPILVDHDSVLYYMEELKFYDALMRSEEKEGEWSVPENITPAIGSDGDHIIVGASADGSQLLLYIYEPMLAGEIVTTRYTPEGWSKLQPLNNNINTQYNETFASLSADGRTLYFTSNRPGGYGGLDIYKSERNDSNDWGPAVNLGPVINTPYDEETPIMNSDDELLYFSSQGHLGMGGFDIFYSLKMGDNKWHQPVNMGAPVCTTDDDLFYYPLEEDVSGLMSRLEPPFSAGYDIYRFNSMVFANTPRYNVKGKAEEVDTSNYENYTIAILNNRNSDTIYHSAIEPDGNYELLLPAGDFQVLVLNRGTETASSQVVINESTPETIYLAGTLQKEKIVEKEIGVKSDTLILHSILYAFNASDVLPVYYDYLNRVKDIMLKYPSLVIRVEGYTDAIGSGAYNQALSVRRAQAVSNYLVKQEVDKNRFSITGNGELFPAARNFNADGSDCPEGRKYNRRVQLVPETKIDDLIILQISDIPNELKAEAN
jgi:outer membrane protein OmpA-like peptidoglycan-associated protein